MQILAPNLCAILALAMGFAITNRLRADNSYRNLLVCILLGGTPF